jgi:hypothetical protein
MFGLEKHECCQNKDPTIQTPGIFNHFSVSLKV